MGTVTIRDASVADAREIAELHVDAWRWAYRGLMPDAVLDGLSVDDREARWRAELSAPQAGQGCLLAGSRARSVVGFLSFGPPEEPVADGDLAEVYALYLDRAVVGTGVGRSLLAAGSSRLRDAGFARAFLWVLETNERARRFYERAGWAWDGNTSAHRYDCAELPIVRYAADL